MEMLSFYYNAAEALFLCLSKDTKAEINSNQFKLSAKLHPNQRMQKLWNQYGEASFDMPVI